MVETNLIDQFHQDSKLGTLCHDGGVRVCNDSSFVVVVFCLNEHWMTAQFFEVGEGNERRYFFAPQNVVNIVILVQKLLVEFALKVWIQRETTTNL